MSFPPPPGSVPPPNGFQPPQGGLSGPGHPVDAWHQPPKSPKRGNGWKWILGGVVLVVVIGVTAAVTLSVASKDPGNSGSNTSAPPPSVNGTASAEVASADDTGPVSVITDDPSCAAQYPIMTTWIRTSKNGWGQRDPSIPASSWSPEIRSQYDEVADALRNAADQIVPVARMAQHRVMRELYEQFIAYSRTYAASIPDYAPPADQFARVTIAITETIGNICSAIEFGSAAARGPLVTPLAPPTQVSPIGNTNDPQRFLLTRDPVCDEWAHVMDQFKSDTTAWVQTDPNIPATDWWLFAVEGVEVVGASVPG
ncbi:Uncharacterised protein [Mycolicibacterium smegmatis]|nr:Uncharacterised protein [Mycolicibacterium smegmatis]